jgi:hypothetical protein
MVAVQGDRQRAVFHKSTPPSMLNISSQNGSLDNCFAAMASSAATCSFSIGGSSCKANLGAAGSRHASAQANHFVIGNGYIVMVGSINKPIHVPTNRIGQGTSGLRVLRPESDVKVSTAIG